MEGSESEAIFESLNLKPQLFVNEVLNTVDDLVDDAFTFFQQEASAALKIEGTDKSDDLSKGMGRIRNMIQLNLYKRLDWWEKYCLRHCFVVPEGFSLRKDDTPSDDTLLNLDSLGDPELDAQLDSLRNKLALVGQESAELDREIKALERQSELVQSAASIDEILLLYEKDSMCEMFQEFVKTASEFRRKVEKLTTSRMEEIEYGRAERMRISNGDMFKATCGIGLSNAKLEDLQQLLDDLKAVKP